MERKYGTATHVYIPIPKAGSANHAVSADWTPAAGDVKISKDGGAAANVTNLPTAIAMGNSAIWDFSLTATEMQAATVVVTVADSATKAVDDTGFIIETYGNASANKVFDFSQATPAVNTTQWGGTAVASAVVPANAIQISGDSAAADNAESFFDGTGYAGTNNVIPTVTTLTNAPPDSSGVTTLLSRIPSALFSGITSLANWLALIAGKQTGDSTARTELNARGAGSGTYDETTDSTQAIRDRGDAAYLTATGFSTLDATGVRSAVGLASANLDTQIGTLATSSALTTLAGDVTTLLSRIGSFTGSGVNTVLGFFKALLSKTASTPSDVGGTFDPATDSTEAIRDRGDAAYLTATGFATHSAADVWAVATRRLSDGTNIVLAKGTGVTGFNDLDATGVRGAVGLASANLDTQFAALATAAGVAALQAILDKLNDTLEDDGGTYRFTSNALEQAPSGGSAPTAAEVADEVETRALQLTSAYDFAKGTVAMTESYAADGATITPAQAFYMIWALLAERAIVADVLTANKLDGTTTAMEFQLDDATNPTSQTRSA